tara:strand:+ start:15962 stop:16255 length:294 start_codon:yes stop_codon:yes gene_type:complete
MLFKDKIGGIKEALTLWAYLETKDMDERHTPEEIKQRRKYHLKVFNDFNEITKNLWIGQTDVAPEWQNYVTSVSESEGGEQPKRAEVEGVNAEKGRK